MSSALYVVGDWDEALVHARAAQAIGGEDRLSWIRGRAESVIGTVAAARGAWQEAEACLAIANDAASAGDAAWPELVARLVRSAICRARGDAAGVVEALQPLMSDKRVVIAQMAVVAWWPILVEGLVNTGELVDAAIELDRLQRHVDDTGMDIGGQVMGQRARLTAANGDPDEAGNQFQLAIETIRPDDPLVDRALLRHHYGRLLHARGNRRGAVEYLRAAHEMFAAVGAEPYRQAVAEDLVSCGIRTATKQSPLDFTEREQDVVALVRKGMTNKEIAAEMYVSEKAVEYHLRNVHGKLGITSRRELRSLD
jgi:DNA-binding NarL/FixJ family response regulator